MKKRLTEKQKEEIVKSFESGTGVDVLSQKYTCTKSTIIRNLKKHLGEIKYKELFNESKFLKRKSESWFFGIKSNTNTLRTNIFAIIKKAF